MGEIADALRRARGGWTPFEEDRRIPEREVERTARPPASVERPLRRESGAPEQAAVQLAQLSPRDEAILHGEGPVFEACRQTALRVREALDARAARSVAVVSSVQAEGKTTTSCNLALALASLSPEREVALLDLDLRRPSVASACGIAAGRGVEDVLSGETTLDAVRVQVERPPLDIFPVAEPQRAAHELLARREFREMLAELERRYAYVVVDTSPTLLVPDSRLILERVSCCIPIARAGVSRVRSYRAMLTLLPEGQVLGGVLNGGRPAAYGYYQGYTYDDEPAEGRGRVRRRRAEGGARG